MGFYLLRCVACSEIESLILAQRLSSPENSEGYIALGAPLYAADFDVYQPLSVLLSKS